MPAQVTLAVAALLLGSFVKGVSGTGLPLIAIPILAPIIGTESAIVLFLVPNVATNLILVKQHLPSLNETSQMPLLAGFGALGVTVGAFILDGASQRLLSLALGLVLAAYLLSERFFDWRPLPGRWRRATAPVAGMVAGLLQGLTGVGSPVLIPYLHAYRMPRTAYILSASLLFEIFGLVQIAAMTLTGNLSAEWVGISVLALIPIIIGLTLGNHYGSRLSARRFHHWILATLLLTCLKLFYDAL